jgi:ribulose-5-phosphate 4-epimerase/fuculose-1-phosphate aldolase
MTTSETDNRIAELVDANHILADQGVLDGFGHVSVRCGGDTRRFLIARSMAPALVAQDDIVECDQDGAVHDARGRRSYVERFIHAAIYAVRPEVQAVVHSHSPALIPFGVTGARLRPVCHMSGFLGGTTPVFEMRDTIGESSDLLVRNLALGRALAAALGDASVALMRGHGSVTVGVSLKQAVFRAIQAEANAKLQLAAMPLGSVTYLSDDEARLAAAANDEHLDRPWALWLRAVRGRA